MDFETLTIKTPQMIDPGSIIASPLKIDIQSLILIMKNSCTWTNGEINSMILFRGKDKQIVLTALDENIEIASYNSVETVTFHVIEGKMKFHTRDEDVILGKDQILTLNEKIKFCLTTIEASVFLLTILSSNSHRQEN